MDSIKYVVLLNTIIYELRIKFLLFNRRASIFIIVYYWDIGTFVIVVTSGREDIKKTGVCVCD